MTSAEILQGLILVRVLERYTGARGWDRVALWAALGCVALEYRWLLG
jgi:hypothetical protein